MRHQRRQGQSLAEYVVLLALIAIVSIVVMAGVGQATRDRVAQANPSQQEQVIASKTGASAKPGFGAAGGSGAGPKKDLFEH